MKKQNEVKQLVSREAEQNMNSKKWRLVEKFSDGSMRRLKGAFATQEEALDSMPAVVVLESEQVIEGAEGAGDKKAKTMTAEEARDLAADTASRDAERAAMKAAVQAAEQTMKAEIKAGRKKKQTAATAILSAMATDAEREANKAALAQATKEADSMVPAEATVQTMAKLVAEVEALIPGMGAAVLSEQGKQALAEAEKPEPELGNPQGITVVSGVTGETLATVPAPAAEKAPKAKKASKKAKKAPKAAEKQADGPLTLRLYAKGHFWFGAKQTKLLQGLPYVLVAVDGKRVTITPTKSKKDSQEVKFSHGNPQVSIGKLLAESGWSKQTQDLAITMVGDAIQVEVQ